MTTYLPSVARSMFTFLSSTIRKSMKKIDQNQSRDFVLSAHFSSYRFSVDNCAISGVTFELSAQDEKLFSLAQRKIPRLQSIDFGYKVKVRKAEAEVLHFAQDRDGLVPNNWGGQVQQWKTIGGILTNEGNANIERHFTGGLSNYIVHDLRAIPSR